MNRPSNRGSPSPSWPSASPSRNAPCPSASACGSPSCTGGASWWLALALGMAEWPRANRSIRRSSEATGDRVAVRGTASVAPVARLRGEGGDDLRVSADGDKARAGARAAASRPAGEVGMGGRVCGQGDHFALVEQCSEYGSSGLSIHFLLPKSRQGRAAVGAAAPRPPARFRSLLGGDLVDAAGQIADVDAAFVDAEPDYRGGEAGEQRLRLSLLRHFHHFRTFAGPAEEGDVEGLAD